MATRFWGGDRRSIEEITMTDEELLAAEPLARIRAWDAKSENYEWKYRADEWCKLQRECIDRGLQSSTSWTDFWPTSPRAKALREANGL